MKKSEQRDLFPGALEIMILQSLRLRPMHGYALVKHIKQVSDDLLQVEEGSLYPALQRMLMKGWLVGEWGKTRENRRARYYTLTSEGRKQLQNEIDRYGRVSVAIARILEPAS